MSGATMPAAYGRHFLFFVLARAGSAEGDSLQEEQAEVGLTGLHSERRNCYSPN